MVAKPSQPPRPGLCQVYTAGLEQGSRVGFQHCTSPLRPCKHNMLSASQMPEVVSKYIEDEMAANRLGLSVRRASSAAHDSLQSIWGHPQKE